jgi:predicted dehydrogenase
VILYLFGSEPVRIEATGQCFLQPGVEDVVFATLHFRDGRVASVHVSWLDPHKQRSMVLVGSAKMLVFDDMEAGDKIRLYDKSATISFPSADAHTAVSVRHGDIVIPRIPNSEPLALETQHFVDSILNDTPPRSDGRDGLRVVRVLEAVDRELRASIAPYMRKAA